MREEQRVIPFRMGELFPPEHFLSAWLLAVCTAYDDALRAGRAYLRWEQAEEDAAAYGDRQLAKAEKLYYARLLCAHLAEGIRHVSLTATDRKRQPVYAGESRQIQDWIREDGCLGGLHSEVVALDKTTVSKLKAFRISTFHYPSEHYGTILGQMREERGDILFRRGTGQGQGGPFLLFAAPVQMRAVREKARELTKTREVPCAEKFLEAVIPDILRVFELLELFVVQAFKKRWREVFDRGLGE